MLVDFVSESMINIFDLYRQSAEQNNDNNAANNDAPRQAVPRRVPPPLRHRPSSNTKLSTDQQHLSASSSTVRQPTRLEKHPENITASQSSSAEWLNNSNGIDGKQTRTTDSPVFRSDALSKLLTSSTPITGIHHCVCPRDDIPLTSSIPSLQRSDQDCNPMRQCCSLDARQALQAFAPSVTAARCVFARRNRSQTAELNDVSEGTSAINRTIESVASNSVDDSHTHQGMPVLSREHATTPCFVAPLPSDHQQSTTSVKKRPYHRRKDSFPQERSEASSKTNNKSTLRRRRSAPTVSVQSSTVDGIPRKRGRKPKNKFTQMDTVTNVASILNSPQHDHSQSILEQSRLSNIDGADSNTVNYNDFIGSNSDMVENICDNINECTLVNNASNDNTYNDDSHESTPEDEIIYEAEILSINEKNLVVKLLKLCREYINEVNTKESNWLDQLMCGISLKQNELRQKTVEALQHKRGLFETYSKLSSRCNHLRELYSKQRQKQLSEIYYRQARSLSLDEPKMQLLPNQHYFDRSINSNNSNDVKNNNVPYAMRASVCGQRIGVPPPERRAPISFRLIKTRETIQ